MSHLHRFRHQESPHNFGAFRLLENSLECDVFAGKKCDYHLNVSSRLAICFVRKLWNMKSCKVSYWLPACIWTIFLHLKISCHVVQKTLEINAFWYLSSLVITCLGKDSTCSTKYHLFIQENKGVLCVLEISAHCMQFGFLWARNLMTQVLRAIFNVYH
jgi:hypothetical protein